MIIKEQILESQMLGSDLNEKELSELQKKYIAYFTDTMKKYGADSPAAMSKEEQTKFFNDIKSGWEIGVGPK